MKELLSKVIKNRQTLSLVSFNKSVLYWRKVLEYKYFTGKPPYTLCCRRTEVSDPLFVLRHIYHSHFCRWGQKTEHSPVCKIWWNEPGYSNKEQFTHKYISVNDPVKQLKTLLIGKKLFSANKLSKILMQDFYCSWSIIYSLVVFHVLVSDLRTSSTTELSRFI